jgi:hypothetical protein
MAESNIPVIPAVDRPGWLCVESGLFQTPIGRFMALSLTISANAIRQLSVCEGCRFYFDGFPMRDSGDM